MKKSFLVTAAVAMLCLGSLAQANITIDTVAVGNKGNAADTTGYGSVGYDYNIGKYEVTAGQYPHSSTPRRPQTHMACTTPICGTSHTAARFGEPGQVATTPTA